MKPVAIFRHSPAEGPGHFATFLERHSVPSRLIAVDRGEGIPVDSTGFSGLCFMGGPMSANDADGWIAASLALIRDADAHGIPVLGHCLGAQLMAKAFGARVTRNPAREIGWGEASVPDNGAAREWFGATERFEAFHWHGETFGIPAAATRILESRFCANQGFVLGPHLALQCHVEMTPEMVRRWSREGAAELAAHAGASVQTAEAMCEDLDRRCAALNGVADRLYERWLRGLDGQ
ncbi:MAG: GMP synthase [Rhodocyclaceae bacterium]